MVFIVEAFFSGCISKIINDGKDYSWAKIKSVISDRHDQSKSTKIYRIIEKALNFVTNNTHKNSDDLYNAIEKIFNEFKNNGDTLESVKCGLRLLGTDISDQRCETFLGRFYEGIRQDDDLYKEVMMTLQQKEIKISQEGFSQINEKLHQNHMELVEKLDDINENLNEISLINEKSIDTKDLKFQNNKKEDYIKIWNSKLFLHLDNDKRPITLADAFIMPDFLMYKFVKKIEFTIDDTLDEIIERIFNYEKISTTLITGVPGMGKTSIVSWIAQKYKVREDLIILRFRDWDSEDLSGGLLKAICNTLECKRRDLNKKLLVLDGFDEIKSLYNREQILNEFLNDIKDLEKSKIIITSRPNYIAAANFDNDINLLPFNIKKIRLFYNKLTNQVLNETKIDNSNLEVMGIPVILYMAIMSNIDITKKSNKSEVYNLIFAEREGIFDRFSEYDNGSHIMRNADNVKKYLIFLQKTAFEMFERDELSLLQEECKIPNLKFEGKDVSILEFPIKHLFENTNYNIEFIHKSIYEYFASEFIIWSLNDIIKKDEFKIEDLAGVMGRLFKYGRLSFEIIEFLWYRVRKDLNDKYDIVCNAFNLMLQEGMTYYTNEQYKNIIDREARVFINMLQVIHLWERECFDFNMKVDHYIRVCPNMFKVNLIRLNLIEVYLNRVDLRGADLREAKLIGAHLRGAILSELDLRGVDLSKADLRRADLSRTNLRGADLREANLSRANLSRADLRGVNLREAKLTGAHLRGTILSEETIQYLKEYYNLQGTKVYIKQTQELIDYQEYCKKNQ